MNTTSYSYSIHVNKCTFLLDNLYIDFGGKVSLTDSLLR